MSKQYKQEVYETEVRRRGASSRLHVGQKDDLTAMCLGPL